MIRMQSCFEHHTKLKEKMKFIIKNTFVLALSMISLNTYAQATGQIRANYIKAFVPSCIENQKSLPENKGIPIKTINSYCKCMAQTSANGLTNPQLEMLDNMSNQDLQQNAFLQSVIKKSTEYCQVNFNKF
jgi:hypothetical protein